MINLSKLLKESYYDSFSDEEHEDHARSYFDIGQDEEESHNNFCWIWNGNSIIYKKGGTHGSNFSHDIADRNFKGWYDVEKNKISVVFPAYELRKIGDIKPTVDDIPQRVYKALLNTFGLKRNPQLVIFEGSNLSSLVRDEKIKSSWMDPSGKLHPIRDERDYGHAYWAQHYLDSMGIPLETSIYHQMFKLGFIRVAVIGSVIHIDYERGCIKSSNVREIKNIAIEQRLGLFDDVINKYILENGKDREEVFESLKLIDILYENGVLGTDINHIGSWMGPDTRIYPVGYAGHLAWAAKYIKDHDIDLEGFENDIYTKMFGLGFIRIVKLYDKAVAVEYHIPYGIRPNQLKELRNLGIENGLTIQDATARRYITKDGEELDESLNLVDILKESMPSESIADAWFGPDNKIHSISGYIHVTWARQYLKSIGLEDTHGYLQVYQEMFNRGFVRISGGTTKFHIEYSKERGIKPSQLRELKNIAIERNLSLYDDITSRYVRNRGEDLDESMNNYTDRVEDSWFGPDNKLHSIQGKIHATWARDFLQKLGVPTGGPAFDVYGEMYERGFIRVKGGANQRQGFNIEYSKERGIKPSQLRELKNIAIETRSNLFDDITHKSIYTVDEVIDESRPQPSPSKIGNGWMDSDAKFHRLETSHVAWGRKYLTAKNPDFKGDNVSIYGEMYKLGFIRVHESFAADTISIDYDRTIDIKPKQLKELKDLCIENGLRLMDDVIHKCYIGDGGVEIHESLNLINILSESDVKRQFIYDFWFGPDCKMYRLDKYETHIIWAKRYLASLKPPVKYNDSADIYERMFNLGFIRGAGAGEPRDLYLRFNPDAVKPRQLKELKDFSIEMGVEMHDDADAWYRIARRGLTETENSGEIEEESSMTDGWLDKHAVFHPLNGHSHITWAEEYLEHNGIHLDIHNTYEQMFRLGFVRVRKVYFSNVLHYEYTSGHHILPKQKKELIDLALENRLSLYDNVRDEYIVKDRQIV